MAILEDVATAANLSIQSLGLKKTALMPEPCDKLLQPRPNARGWWHAHNVTLVEQWLRGGGAGHSHNTILTQRCKKVNNAFAKTARLTISAPAVPRARTLAPRARCR